MSIKGPFSDPSIKKIEKKNIKILERSSTILPEHIGCTIAIHNGKEYKTFGKVTINHIGKKFGEFSATKKPARYKKKYK